MRRKNSSEIAIPALEDHDSGKSNDEKMDVNSAGDSKFNSIPVIIIIII